MKKYFLKNEDGQQGPYSLDELKDKNINAGTAIRSEDTEEWTTAGQLEELKGLITPAAAIKAVETTTVSATAAPVAVATATPVAKAAATQGKAWVTWVLSLAAIAGAGYFVYQDMEKNKDSSKEIVIADSTAVQTTDSVAFDDITNTSNDPDSVHFMIVDSVTTDSEPPMAVTTATTTADQAKAKEVEDNKKKVAAKKAADDKKKLLAADAKRKEDEKKRQLAAQAAFEKEKEMRNNWPRYVRVGTYEIKGDDQVKPFSIPVSNGYLVPIENVTLRVDYLKKEKLVGTEILTLSNISPRSTQNVQAAGNKKGKRVNVYITGISSRQLHFCYPVNSGNMADPYYCK
jgi:GYF domain 2